jgi:hypothetical protein
LGIGGERSLALDGQPISAEQGRASARPFAFSTIRSAATSTQEPSMFVIHPHYTGRDKGATYNAKGQLLCFTTAEQARDYQVALWDADPRRSHSDAVYYADHHVTYRPLDAYLGTMGDEDFRGPFTPTLCINPLLEAAYEARA